MGCHTYTVSGWVQEKQGWDEGGIKFDEMNDDLTCLCTFPPDTKLDLETVRSLAYLGAAVVLQHQGHKEYRFLPHDLPQWMREEIDRAVLARPSTAGKPADKPCTKFAAEIRTWPDGDWVCDTCGAFSGSPQCRHAAT